jgi:parallel beta-helix repeat protein
MASSSQVALQVGEGNNLGTIIAMGSEEHPVTFTSSLSQPTPGNWRMIILTSKAMDCVLDNVKLLYGGMNQGYDTDSELLVETSSASITSCTFSFSGKHGMCLQSNADPYTFNNTFTDNGGHGIYTKSMQNDIDFSFNNFPGNSGSGCYNSDGTYWVDASYSYWGSEDGPSGIGPGTGDEATGQVIIDPWLPEPVTPSMELSSNTDSLSYEECSAMIYITTGLRWSVSSENDWISFDTTQGTKVDSFMVNFTENPSADPRKATIHVSSGDTLTQLFDITQPGAPPVFAHNAPDLLPTEAGTVDIILTTNYAWTINHDCDWITVDPTGGNFDDTITVTYTDNMLYELRKCTLTVVGGGISEDILLTQEPVINSASSLTGQDYYKIYPNPAVGGELYIMRSYPAGTIDPSFTLVNSLGQALISGKLPAQRNRIDVSHVPDGIYLIRISGAPGSLSDHVIVIQK